MRAGFVYVHACGASEQSHILPCARSDEEVVLSDPEDGEVLPVPSQGGRVSSSLCFASPNLAEHSAGAPKQVCHRCIDADATSETTQVFVHKYVVRQAWL